MAQLYYKYGTMNSGKTIEILKVAHNYEEQGKSVVIMTSAIDTRDGFGVVSSRIGMKREAIAIEDDTDVFGYIQSLKEKPYCVLVDEAQFLKRHHVYDLARVVDELDVPVMALASKMISEMNSLKVPNTSSCWQTRSRRLRPSANIVPARRPWSCVLKRVNPSTMESRFKSVDTRPISPFAANIILIQTFTKNINLKETT